MSAKPDTWQARPSLKDIVRLIRKRWWRKSYAQHGEDMALVPLLSDIKRGTYVDVGCFHPRRYSNTRLLFEGGWHGVNIDISPRKLAFFEFDRPKDHNICCAASRKTGELKAYVFGADSALDTTDKEVAEEWSARFNRPYQTVTVPCRPLSEILDDCGVAHINYLNVDVEGAEMDVLAGLDFERFGPKCVSIEIHGNLEQVSESEVYRFLVEKGFELHSWIRPTFIFARPD